MQDIKIETETQRTLKEIQNIQEEKVQKMQDIEIETEIQRTLKDIQNIQNILELETKTKRALKKIQEEKKRKNKRTPEEMQKIQEMQEIQEMRNIEIQERKEKEKREKQRKLKKDLLKFFFQYDESVKYKKTHFIIKGMPFLLIILIPLLSSINLIIPIICIITWLIINYIYHTITHRGGIPKK